MRVLKREWLARVGLVLALLALPCASAWAQAEDEQISTDRSGSIVIFPKVISDGTRDTIIKLTNTSNMSVLAECKYFNGAGRCELSERLCDADGDCDENESCVFTWTPINFRVALTRQQPTMWRVSGGRRPSAGGGGITPPGDECEEVDGQEVCPGFFFTATSVPAQGFFRGSLVCFEADPSTSPTNPEPMGFNALKGEAVLFTIAEDGNEADPQVSKYNSINVPAIGDPTAADGLELDGVEYAACPLELEFPHYAAGATDVVAAALEPTECEDTVCTGGPFAGDACMDDGDCGGGVCTACPVRTRLTFVPCTLNVRDGFAPVTRANFELRNEFEVFQGSEGVDVDCFVDFDTSREEVVGGLSFIASNSSYLKTVARFSGGRRCQVCTLGLGPSDCPPTCTVHSDCGSGGVCGPPPGILGVVEEFYGTDSSIADSDIVPGTAAFNMHMRGARVNGRCATTNVDCDADADCMGGGNFCIRDRIILP
jgi:hypothetical protein